MNESLIPVETTTEFLNRILKEWLRKAKEIVKSKREDAEGVREVDTEAKIL